MSSNKMNFVSETVLEENRERRKKEWAETYERLNQAPPPELTEETYDPRSLYEKLQEQKDKKQADFEERIKFKNQFVGIDEEESLFLADLVYDKKAQDRARQEEIDAELSAFRQKQSHAPPALPIPATSTSSSSVDPAKATSNTPAKPLVKPPPKKTNQRSLLAGAVKRKKSDEPSKPQTEVAARSEDSANKKAKTSAT